VLFFGTALAVTVAFGFGGATVFFTGGGAIFFGATFLNEVFFAPGFSSRLGADFL
jgi:hypothetical protein